MSEAPDIPPPPPEIPQGRIWGALLTPPAVTIGAAIAVRMGTPMDISNVALLVTVILVPCFTIFYRNMSRRYRGISMTLMEIGFLTGQLIVCSAIGVLFVYLDWRFP